MMAAGGEGVAAVRQVAETGAAATEAAGRVNRIPGQNLPTFLIELD